MDKLSDESESDCENNQLLYYEKERKLRLGLDFLPRCLQLRVSRGDIQAEAERLPYYGRLSIKKTDHQRHNLLLQDKRLDNR